MPSSPRPRLLAASVAVAAAVLSATPPASADEPVRPPQSSPDEFPDSSARGRVAATGVAVFAGFYGAALGASYAWPSAPGADELRYPVAGPWIALAETGCPASDPNCPVFPVVLRAVLTALDGVAQAGGLGIALESALMPTAGERAEARARQRHVRAVPFTAGRDGVGLAIVGRF